jgi:hypothetical protein
MFRGWIVKKRNRSGYEGVVLFDYQVLLVVGNPDTINLSSVEASPGESARQAQKQIFAIINA